MYSKLWSGKLNGNHLEDVGGSGRIMLQMILERWDVFAGSE